MGGILLADAGMIEDDPGGQDGIQVRFIGKNVPFAGLQIQSLHVHHQGLFAGRQGKSPHASLVVIQVVDLVLMVQKRFALGHAV